MIRNHFRRRPFFILAFCFCAGILLAWEWNLAVWILLLFLAVSFFALCVSFRCDSAFIIFLCLAFFISGATFFSLEKRQFPSELSAFAQCNQPVDVIGKVSSCCEAKKRGRAVIVEFVMDTEAVRVNGIAYPASGKADVFWYGGHPAVCYGQRLRLRGKLEMAEEARNPGQFNFRAYLRNQGIDCLLRVFGTGKVRFLTDQVSWLERFIRWVFTLRVAIRDRIDQCLAEPFASVLVAFLIGVRSNIPPAIKDAFILTGTMHILAISGAHLVAISAMVYFLFRFLRFPLVLTTVLTVLILIFYTILAGLNIPVVRSTIMSSLFLLALPLQREKDTLNLLGLAALVLFVTSPSVLFNLSFLLSFLSVLSIVVLFPVLSKQFPVPPPRSLLVRVNWLRRFLLYYKESVMISVAVLLGLSPVLIWVFNLFSPVTVVANLLAIPLFSLILFLGVVFMLSLLGPSSLSALLSALLQLLLSAAIGLIAAFAQVKWARFFVPRPALWMAGLYYLFLGWIFLKWHRRRFWIGVVFLFFIPLFWCVGLAFKSKFCDSLRATFLATTYGRVALIEAGGKTLLVNSGSGSRRDEGRWIVQPFLRSKGIQALDAIVISSGYKKDWGALADLLQKWECGTLFVPMEFRFSEKFLFLSNKGRKRKNRLVYFKGGDFFRLGDAVEIAFFQQSKISANKPSKGTLDQTQYAIRLQSRDGAFLFLPTVYLRETFCGSDGTFLRADVVWIPLERFTHPASVNQWVERFSPSVLVLGGRVSGTDKGWEEVEPKEQVVFLSDQGAAEVQRNNSSQPFWKVQTYRARKCRNLL